MRDDLQVIEGTLTNREFVAQVPCFNPMSTITTVTSSPVVGLFGAAGWVLEAAKKLEALGRLPAGWDSYGGLPLRHEVREMTVRVLDRLKVTSLPVPTVALGSNGTVHLEWEAQGRELELGLGAGATVGYVKVGPDGEIDEGQADAGNQEILRLTRWLMGGATERPAHLYW